MEPIFTPAELSQVHAYVYPYYDWTALRDVIGIAVFVLILRFAVRPLFALASRISNAAEQRFGFARRVPVLRALPAALDRLWGGSGWGAALWFSALYLLLIELIYLPRDIYFSYFHEHAFGLSNYTPAAYAIDELKSLALQVVASAFLAFGLYGLARRMRAWWLVLGVVAGAVMLFSSAMDPYRAQLFFKQTPLPGGELRDRITEVMSRAGIEFRDVVVEKTSRVSKTVNAYFAGQGPTRTIVLNDTLVDQLTPSEVVAVVAHEAGHVRESRWPRRVLASLALLGFLFLVDRLLRLAQRRGWFGATEFADIRTLPMIGFALWILLTVGHPLSAADSREREAAADAYALGLTRNPAAFRSMLVKAARINKFDPDPPRWIELRSLSHPSIASRLAQVSAWEKKTSSE